VSHQSDEIEYPEPATYPAHLNHWKPPKPPGIGLGDLVAFITRYTGIAYLVRRRAQLSGKSCGCASRRENLNRYRLVLPLIRTPV